jgi:WD40 repeat protein
MENDATKRSIRVGPHARSSLALTADGKMLALANNTGISLRDMADGEEIRAWSGRVANGAVFSPDSKRLAWIGFDERNRKAQLWTAERDSGKRRAIGEPVDNFGPPCFSPDGKLLAITTYHHVVLLRDAASGKEITSFDAHPSAVIDVAFSADGQQVVSHAHDGARFVWQTRSGKLLRRWPASPMKDEEVVLRLPKGRVVMTERQNNKEIYRVRELLTGGEKFRIDGWLGAGPRPTAAPGGRYLALRDLKGDLRVIDLQTGQSRSVAGPSQATHGLKLSADGDVAVWYDNLNKPLEVHVNRQSSAKKLVLRDMPKTDRWVWIFDRQPCVSPDGRWLVLSTEEGRLRRWDLTTGKEVSPLTEALRTTWELIWSPDGRFVAAQGAASPANVIDREAHRDLRVWDARAGARLAHLTVPNRQGGMHVHFSRDNRTMLTTDLQGIIHLWEIATGKERARLKGHLPYEIGALAVSADGRMLVSGGYDSQALVWDLTGRTPDGQWRTARHPPEKLRAAWKALASEDAKAAYAAMWQLVADPEGSVSLLRQQLRPIARPTAGQIARLIAELDSEKFTEREHAVHELEMLEEIAATELRQTLTRKPSLEVRRRVEALLERLNHSPTGAQLQALRAIETLEHIDTSEARQVLKMLAKGAPEARTTEEAKAARTRLERQSREQP